MQIRLTRKFADAIDGIDLSLSSVGDLIDLPQRAADLLIAEGWALPHTAARHDARGDASKTPAEGVNPHGRNRSPR